jgi:phospholipid/cholesterol/gamma-HCH transport system substrate-binding protein
MNNAQMSARVGLFFLVGIALIWVTFASLSNGKLTREKGYTLTATFRNLKELKTGDEVRMAGVRIGSVVETRLNGRKAEAVLLIDNRVQVCKDAGATVAMAGLLGNNYVSIDLGNESSGFLEAGTAIKSLDTPDLNSLVTQMGEIGKKIDNALSDFNSAMGGKDGKGILGKVDKLIGENEVKIGQLTNNLAEVSERLKQGEGTLGKLINDPKLHDEMLVTVGEIKNAANEAKLFVSNAQGIIEQVKSGQGSLGVLLYDKQAGENIKVVTKNLREISDKLNKGEGTLGKLINDEGLYQQTQGAIKKLDRALDGMADQGPITAVGVTANALF